MKSEIKLDEHIDKASKKENMTQVWVQKFNEEEVVKFGNAILDASAKDNEKPIVIYIDSYGGYVDSLAAMISILDSIPNKIITVCTGKAMSCGAILLSHGDIRCVTPHSRVMIHEVSAASWGNVQDVKNTTKEIDRLNNYFMKLLALNCKLKGGYNALRKMFKEQRDVYMDAKQSVDFGIADRIGIPEVEKVVNYKVKF